MVRRSLPRALDAGADYDTKGTVHAELDLVIPRQVLTVGDSRRRRVNVFR